MYINPVASIKCSFLEFAISYLYIKLADWPGGKKNLKKKNLAFSEL